MKKYKHAICNTNRNKAVTIRDMDDYRVAYAIFVLTYRRPRERCGPTRRPAVWRIRGAASHVISSRTCSKAGHILSVAAGCGGVDKAEDKDLVYLLSWPIDKISRVLPHRKEDIYADSTSKRN